MATTDPLPHLMNVTDLADHLGVEVRHVRRLVHERRVPYIKWGHLLRFDPPTSRNGSPAAGSTRAVRRADHDPQLPIVIRSSVQSMTRADVAERSARAAGATPLPTCAGGLVG